MLDENKTVIDLTEIVRKEVKIALKALLSETVNGNTQSIGDYESKRVNNASQVSARQLSKDNEIKSDGAGIALKKPVTVKKPDGSIEHRRRKRTQSEMREAITNALPIVKAKHPTWSDKRVRRLAKNLVRRYKL